MLTYKNNDLYNDTTILDKDVIYTNINFFSEYKKNKLLNKKKNEILVKIKFAYFNDKLVNLKIKSSFPLGQNLLIMFRTDYFYILEPRPQFTIDLYTKKKKRI